MLTNLLLSLSLAFLLAFTAFAQTSFKGQVVGVVDGDTVTILDKQYRQITVRLAGIDAPEKRQDFGAAAKEFLSKLIFEKKVTIIVGKTDRYGRTVGVILLNGKDINLLMVEAGYAWHYKEYEDEQSANDRELYAAGETNARKSSAGLWRQPNAVKPSEFRKSEKAEMNPTPPLTAGGRTPLDGLVIQPPSVNPTTTTGGSGNSNVTVVTPTGEDASSRSKTVHVDGYYRKDGTYVPPHTRSAPSRRKN